MFFFFFQAEDGIRVLTVTGVQTCALPISYPLIWARRDQRMLSRLAYGTFQDKTVVVVTFDGFTETGRSQIGRASCREKCRSRWSTYHITKKIKNLAKSRQGKISTHIL